MKDAKQALIEAKAVLVDQGWTQGVYEREGAKGLGSKRTYCAIGALNRVLLLDENNQLLPVRKRGAYLEENGVWTEAIRHLASCISDEEIDFESLHEDDYEVRIILFNDMDERKKEQILEKFDCAIGSFDATSR